jgi:hypothetical protein
MTAPKRGEVNANGASSLRAWLAEAEAAAAIAAQLATTAFVPESLKRYHVDDEGRRTNRLDIDATVQTVTAALLAGQELGFGPMASLRSIAIIRNTPVLSAHAARGLLLQRGHEITVVEATATRAVVRARREGSDTVQQSVWTLDRARALGVANNSPDNNYRKQGAAMLVARATAEASRWVAADALLGLPYIDVEILDLPAGMVAGELEGADADASPRRRGARRRTTSPGPLALPAVPAQGGAPAAEQTGGGEQRRSVRKIGKAQQDRMHAAFRELGIGRDDALGMIAGWVNHAIETTSQLSYADASRVLAELDELLAARIERSDDGGGEVSGDGDTAESDQ